MNCSRCQRSMLPNAVGSYHCRVCGNKVCGDCAYALVEKVRTKTDRIYAGVPSARVAGRICRVCVADLATKHKSQPL